MSAPMASETRRPFRAKGEMSACSAGAPSRGDQERTDLVAVQADGSRLVGETQNDS